MTNTVYWCGASQAAKSASSGPDGDSAISLRALDAGHASYVDRALQGIDGFTAIEPAQQLATKGLIDEVIGQEHRAQQATEMPQGFIQWIPARS
jgi:hypothetical protein